MNPLNIITFWLASTTPHIPLLTKWEGTFVKSAYIDSQIQIVIILPYLAHKLDRQCISNTKTTQLSLFLLCSNFVLTPASVQLLLSQSRHNVSSRDHRSFLRVSPPAHSNRAAHSTQNTLALQPTSVTLPYQNNWSL